MNRRRFTQNNSGFTLVELLVVMAISLVLLGGLYQVYSGSLASYSTNNGLSRIQENGRFAFYQLRRSLSGAGYLGCLQDESALTSTLGSSSFNYDYSQAIYGLEALNNGTWQDNSGTVDPTVSGSANLALNSPAKKSDILVVREIDPEIQIAITADIDKTATEIQLSSGLQNTLVAIDDEVLLLTGCEGATLFEWNSYSNSTGIMTLAAALGNSYTEDALIFAPQTVVYYVSENTAGQPTLFRRTNSETALELVENVETMQIRYGLDNDSDNYADSYVTAAGVSDWDDVVSVRIGLLLRSNTEIQHGEIDSKEYDVDGDGSTDFDPVDDRRLRIIMSTTVGLRNKLH